MRRAKPLLPYVLLLPPPLLTGALILRFGVDLPYWDEWVHLQTLVKYHAGTLTLSDLFAQYNESRKPFPRLLILLLAQTGLADQRWQMAVSWLLAAFTLLMLVQLARTGERPAGALTLLTASTLLFSFTAWQNWLWGIQFICLVPLAGLCLTMRVCTLRGCPGWLMTAVAAASATVATYSFASGMLIWPLCGLALRMLGRVTWPALAAFAAVGAAALGTYFHHYTQPAWTPDFADSLADPVRFVGYILTLAGGGLVPSEASAAAALPRLLMPLLLGGLITLVAGTLAGHALLRSARDQSTSALPWALIAAYSLAAMAVTSLGRSPFGLETALLSRYATFSLPTGIAAVAMLSLLPRSRLSRTAAATLAGVLITCVVMSSLMVLPRVQAVHDRQLTGRAMLTFCLTAPDAVQTTFVADWPQHPLIVPTAVTLSQAGLLVPPVSPEGDPAPWVDRSAPPMPATLQGTTLLIPNRDVHSVLVVSPVPRPTVVRVLHAFGSPGKSPRFVELPTLPPGAALLAVTGPDLRAVPLRLAP